MLEQDTLDAAAALISALGSSDGVLVLAMGNPDSPGGGWRSGSAAQEEELFRRTSLAMALDPAAGASSPAFSAKAHSLQKNRSPWPSLCVDSLWQILHAQQDSYPSPA